MIKKHGKIGPVTKHLLYLNVKGMRKEIKKLKISIRTFMLLDREM